ncbi:MAG: NAD(P)H-hydrate epimerase [Candidatus Omnitrophica bacterium]|nr:NAD(P)H-hydrate epimerase [Candidatus Omnitrophota bacterium]MDE2231243.1 NAD(P)H-hydrate epimerase [Candidatus Omnitrophota bacterium]
MGIPSLVLMENAGRGVALHVCKYLKRRRMSRVVIVCGAGNNGGDGFVAARYLLNFGFRPSVFFIGALSKLKADALVNYRAAKNLKIPVKPVRREDAAFKKALRSADVIVDAIFGVGLNRSLEAPYDGIIQAINASNAYVVAVDVPSGLDGTGGGIYGICVVADLTVTFSFPKKGFFKKHAARYTGRVAVVDIGIPVRTRL